MPPAIRVEKLGKRYRLGHAAQQAGYRTLRESLVAAATAPIRRIRSDRTDGESRNFWALQGLDFQVDPGEVVGIIGRNGAGKSTLLKVLSRITKPTTGRVELRGRVGSLLEVGTGFHPELTGRENIFLNGAILGMARRDIRRKFDEIVAFAEVNQFLDTPVKRYSSGMYVRLAFAVAAHLETEILVVDEVLAVGDSGFQKKCLGKMGDIRSSGRTVLFVSHGMATILALCPRAILLDSGRVAYDGPAEEAIGRYFRANEAPGGVGRDLPASDDGVTVERFQVEDAAGEPVSHVSFLDPIQIVLDVVVDNSKRDLHALIILWRRSDGCRVASMTTRELPGGELTRGRTKLTFQVDPNPLLPGDYYWSVSILNSTFRLNVEDVAPLSIAEKIIPGGSHPYTAHHGVCHIGSSLERAHRS